MTDTVDDQADRETARFEAIADAACERLARNQRVRRNLPGDGRLRIDRQLPFLCVYRAPPGRPDAGTRDLVTTEAAYLFASGDPGCHDGICNACRRIGCAMLEHFGLYLLIEIWAGDADDFRKERPATAPAFHVVAPDGGSLPTTLEAFVRALSGVAVQGRGAEVTLRESAPIAPPGLPPLSPVCDDSGSLGCCPVGVAVRPVYRDQQSGTLFPLLLQQLRWQFSRALRKAIAEFTGIESGSDHVHYDSLGPSSLVKAARVVDRQLSEVAESFDFLLQATPTNSAQAWNEFTDSGCRETPTLYYRPLPYHPSDLKRRLFDAEIRRIEDPTLAHLFWEKQDEVDRQLTALRDIDTPAFRLGSLQLYGGADDGLVDLARSILNRFPHVAPGDDRDVTAEDVVEAARDEIDHYYQQFNAFDAKVELSDDIAAGIMVSRDRLLVSRDVRLRPEQVEPLLHHEIGTHLLTYFNGRCQPFRQLYAGLAGYDELQEGLAVFAEYLCGGLSGARMRILAGRVMAVRSMTGGAVFPETYALLHDEFGFPARTAFVSTLRAHRAGGLTKDVIYLRGLRDLLEYLGQGHDIEPLYVGKISLRHLPYVQELRRRGIIDAPKLLPGFRDESQFRRRLDAARGASPLQLLEAE